jgi:hypothetical protein
MKKALVLQCLAAALMAGATALSAQEKKPSGVQIVTHLTEKGMPVTDYTTVFMCKGKVADSVHITNPMQPIRLEKGRVYTVYYKKPGCPDKCVIIDTNLPEEAISRPFRVYINVELNPVFSKQRKDTEDFPSAIIRYIKKDKNFGYMHKYHEQIHQG